MARFNLIPVCFVFFALLLNAHKAIAANDCGAAVPPGGLYNVFRSWTSSDFQLAIDDFVSRKDYQTHDQALSDGLSVGTIVYGVPLQVGNTFSQSQKDTWKQDFNRRFTLKKIVDNRQTFEQLTLNTEAIRLITGCIIQTSAGLHASIDMSDDCIFTFSVSYRSLKVGDSQTAKLTGSLSVSGGRCEPWPTKEVLPGALAVICNRVGSGGVIVTLPTDAGSATATVPALPDPGPQPSPPQYSTNTQSHNGEFRADKNSSATGAGLGEGVEIRVVITAPEDITNISYRCEGGSCGWVYVCPDGGKCGNFTREFDISGNTATFHAWTNSSDPATLIFPYTYQTYSRTCVANCDYSTRLSLWQQKRNRTCNLAWH